MFPLKKYSPVASTFPDLGALIGLPSGAAISMPLWGFRGWSLKKRPGSIGQLMVGAGSGFANSAAIGGLPVGLFLSAQNTKPASFRANMIGYLFTLDIIGIAIMAYHDRFSVDIVLTALALLPVMFTGVYLGSRQFFSTPPTSFRHLVIILLISLALAGLAKSFL